MSAEDLPVSGPAISAVVIAGSAMPVQSSLSPTEKKTLRALEARIGAGIKSFRDVGGALLEIRDSRLYRDTHSSFEAYTREKWDLERARAYQFMSAAEVMQALPDGRQHMVTNEAQARALAPILRNKGIAGVERVLDAIRNREQPMTAPLIRRVEMESVHPATPELTATDRLVRDMSRLGSSYRQWQATGPARKEKSTVRAAADQLIEVLR